MKKIIVAAVIAGFLGVLAGAFGAHALADRLAETGHTGTWDTAVLYHLVHAVALLALGSAPVEPTARRRAGCCWLGGIGLFSGSLYALALGGPRWLGPITPLGGLLFLMGWALVALGVMRSRES